MKTLTRRALGHRNLSDACPVSTGEDLHLTLVLVELPIRPAHRLAIVAAVSVAGAALKLLLLQAAEHVALVWLHETCRKLAFFLEEY